MTCVAFESTVCALGSLANAVVYSQLPAGARATVRVIARSDGRLFVGVGMDDAVWTPATFTKNRERLLEGDIARTSFENIVEQARGRRLLSHEHFTVDGTLLEAWAGQESFRRKTSRVGRRRMTPGAPR